MPYLRFEDVERAVRTLIAQGEKVNATTVRDLIGHGSFSTIGKHLETYRRNLAQDPVMYEAAGRLPEPVQASVQALWQAAIAEATRIFEAERSGFENKIAAAHDAAEEAVHAKTSLEATASALRERIEDLSSALAAANTQLTAEREAFERARNEWIARENELRCQADASSQDIRAQLDQSLETVKRLTADLAAANERIQLVNERYEGDTRFWQNQVAEKKTELTALEVKLRQSEGQLQLLSSEKVGSKAELEALQQQLARADAELVSRTKRCDELASSVTTLAAANGDATARVSLLSTSVKQAQAAHDRLRAQFEQMRSQNAALLAAAASNGISCPSCGGKLEVKTPVKGKISLACTGCGRGTCGDYAVPD